MAGLVAGLPHLAAAGKLATRTGHRPGRALAGMVMLRGVRFLFGLGRGKEGLGIGDADLMMMAGSFLGWQPVLIAFFVGVFAALFVGVAQLMRKGDQALAFGPPLAVGVMITL